jgi:hypothetical protein
MRNFVTSKVSNYIENQISFHINNIHRKFILIYILKYEKEN